MKELKYFSWNADPSIFFKSFFFEKLEILDISHHRSVTRQVVFMILKSTPNLKKLKVASCLHELAEIKEVIASLDIPVYLDV